MANHDPEAFEAAARRSHIDLDPAWSWREPLPKHATGFAESPARSSAAEWPVGYPEALNAEMAMASHTTVRRVIAPTVRAS